MKFTELMEELESLCNEGLYSRDKIAWWLIKYEKNYKGLGKIKETLEAEFPNQNLREQKTFIKELLFIELYEDLDIVFNNSKDKIDNQEVIDLDSIIKKIKTSTNGLNRKYKNFKWDTKHR